MRQAYGGLEEYEAHDTARFCASCAGFAAAVRLRSQVAASSVKADSIATIGSILCAATACDSRGLRYLQVPMQSLYGTDRYRARGSAPMKGKQAVIRARRARPRPATVRHASGCLQAAFAVFREHGFDDASTIEIARHHV